MIFNSDCFEVDPHVVEYGLLVGQMKVVFLFAVHRKVVRSYVFFFIIIFVILFLATTQNLAVLGRTTLVGYGSVPSELRLRAVVTKRAACKLVLLRSRDEIFFAGIAFFVSCLSRQLAVDMSTSSG